MDYSYEIDQIRQILLEAEYAVFFGGAGVSTDSGIPDFRGSDGLYNDNDGQELLSQSCLFGDPERFFRYYKENMLHPYAQPNETHLALAQLEQQGLIHGIITQNIDGLHQKAGSEQVIELHGAARRNYCVRCGKHYTDTWLAEQSDLPHCEDCGGMVRPDITLYGEAPDAEAFSRAQEELEYADVLIVCGSSLTVHPASSLVGDFSGEHLIIINQSPTNYDGLAEILIRDSVSDVFSQLMDLL